LKKSTRSTACQIPELFALLLAVSAASRCFGQSVPMVCRLRQPPVAYSCRFDALCISADYRVYL